MADETTDETIEKVSPLPTGIHCSFRELEAETGLDRETIKKRIAVCGVEPSMLRNGKPVYRLRDVLRAVLLRDDNGNIDPEKLEPYQRQAHYKAQLDKLKLDEQMREVIPRIEVEQEQARVMRVVQLALDTLPDVIERDCGVGGQVVARIEQCVNDLREQMHAALVEGADPQVRTA